MRISIAGLGTVGAGLVSLLADNERLRHQGLDIEIYGVSARTPNKDRGVPLEPYHWADDPVQLASDPKTDLFVELIGGAEGPAKEAVEKALSLGKPVVTANKALIAEHGASLAALAEENEAPLLFEAAVAAGTPVIRGIKDGTAPCDVSSMRGILNGTCNFILSRMTEEGEHFDEVLADAQRAGIAEADPGLDVDGYDAAHKIAILAAMAFDVELNFSEVPVMGIRSVSERDILLGKALGYRIKLIAEAVRSEGRMAIRVMPAMVPEDHFFATISSTDNMVIVESSPLGRLSFGGPGAGAGATASAVASDICALARGSGGGPVFSGPVSTLKPAEMMPADSLVNPYLLGFEPTDMAAAEAAIVKAFADSGVAVERIQQVRGNDGKTLVTLITQPYTRASVDEAAQSLSEHSLIISAPAIYPIVHQ